MPHNLACTTCDKSALVCCLFCGAFGICPNACKKAQETKDRTTTQLDLDL